MDLVIGVDAGGTTTRCLVADLAGRPVGAGTAAGLNQRSSGGDPHDRLTEALGAALQGQDPTAVRAGVLGVAGAGAAGVLEVERQTARAWRGLGLAGGPVIVADLLTAYAAGTPEPDGVVLVGGTGAGAAAVADRALVRQADGAGWLLGDVGSAVWLAREALVAAVAALDGRAPATALVEPLLGRLLGRPAPYRVQDVIARAYAVAPAALGDLAPVVTDLAASGEPVAADIVRRGVAGLLASLDAVAVTPPRVPENSPVGGVRHTPRGGGAVVLAGALLTTDGPVRDGVERGIAERGLLRPRPAQHPAAGAAWLALASIGVTDVAVHQRLSSPSAAIRRG